MDFEGVLAQVAPHAQGKFDIMTACEIDYNHTSSVSPDGG